jgi:hypothetical protein
LWPEARGQRRKRFGPLWTVKNAARYICPMFVTALTASAAASSATPTWVTIFGTASAVITAIGLIVAGAFAYFKYIKGRTLHPRCSIDIEPYLTEVGKTRALRVSVILRNEGHIALLIPSNVEQRLLVSQADSREWSHACARQQIVRWNKSAIEPIELSLAVPEGDYLWQLADRKKAEREAAGRLGEALRPVRNLDDREDPPGWRRLTRSSLLQLLAGAKLEPGEQWARSVLVPVSPDSVAYLLCTRINACRHVALRHVLSHRRRCCPQQNQDSQGGQNQKSSNPSGLTWEREVYFLPGENDNNGQRPTVEATGEKSGSRG